MQSCLLAYATCRPTFPQMPMMRSASTMFQVRADPMGAQCYAHCSAHACMERGAILTTDMIVHAFLP